jgi:hypothetical protein
MNTVFVLDTDPVVAARKLDQSDLKDAFFFAIRRLCNAHYITGSDAPLVALKKNDAWATWASESRRNYAWLCEYARELGVQYYLHTGEAHEFQNVVNWASDNLPNTQKVERTPFPFQLPPEYKGENVVTSYTKYYQATKEVRA